MQAWEQLDRLVRSTSSSKSVATNADGSPAVLLGGAPYQPPLLPFLRTTIEYAQHLWTIVDAGWCVMREGWKMEHPNPPLPSNRTLLLQCGQTYWDSWAAYKAFGLFSEDCPSLYRGVYFNMPGGSPEAGLDATVSQYIAKAQAAV